MAALIAFGVFVWWLDRRKNARQFYTAGNTVNWFVLCMTYIAALMSTWVFFSGPGGYYRGGLTYWISELSYMPLFPVLTYFVMNKVWLLNTERNYTTPADIYDDRFKSPALRLVLAVVFFSVSLRQSSQYRQRRPDFPYRGHHFCRADNITVCAFRRCAFRGLGVYSPSLDIYRRLMADRDERFALRF
jgi:hypothetical protein